MSSLPGYVRAAGAGLALFVAVLLLLRPRTPNVGRDLPLLTLVLLAVGARILAPWPAAVEGLLGLALLWALHLQAEPRCGLRPGTGRWPARVALTAGTVSVAGTALMGYWGTVPSRLLFGFVALPLSVFVSVEHLAPSSRPAAGPRGHPLGGGGIWPYGVAVTTLLASTSLETLFPGSAGLSLASVCSGFLFFGVFGLRLSGIFGPASSPGNAPPELRAARVRLAESERSLRMLDRLAASSLVAAGTVHELKSSLSGILASAQFALRRDPPRMVSEALERIAEHAREAEMTVLRHLEPVLRTGREEARALHLERDLRDLCGALRVACRRSGVSFSLRVEPGAVALARPGEVSQVLLSLARNALESLTAGAGASPDAPGGGRDVDDAPGARGVSGVEAPAGGAMRPGAPRLEIRAARAEAEVIVEVVDNGRGIAPEQVGQLFERAASGTGSTGLGLYLSRLLAESNGGTLGYVPAESGCCFRLTLPAAEAR